MGGSDSIYRAIFLVLVVLDLVAGFQAFGTLLAGVPLLLPAAAARCWAQRIGPLVGLSIGFGMAAGYAGLLVSYHLNVPSGPAIACAAALVYAVSALVPASRMLDDGTQRNQADLRGNDARPSCPANFHRGDTGAFRELPREPRNGRKWSRPSACWAT